MNKKKLLILTFLLSLLGVGTISADGTQESVADYTYTLSGKSGLGTLCFPASVTFWTDGEEKQLKGFRAFTVSGCTDNVLTLQEISREESESAIPENTPVIVYWPYKEGETHSIDCGTVLYYTPQNIEATVTNTNLLGGTTYEAGYSITGSADSKYYIMQDHGTSDAPKVAFYQCSEKVSETEYSTYKIGRFHCWLDMSKVSGARAASLSFSIPESVPTGINAVNKISQLEDGIYSLSGTRVENPVHGEIYIMVMDGKAMKFAIR